MSRSLYEINQDFLTVINGSFVIDEETGEILFDETNLDSLNEEYEKKVDNIACLIKDKLALIEARKNEMKALKERNEKELKQVEYLQNYILTSMIIRDKKKIDTVRNSISYRISKSVDVYAEDLVPSEYVTETIKYSVDKKAIMEALKNGEVVEGCTIQEKKNLAIR